MYIYDILKDVFSINIIKIQLNIFKLNQTYGYCIFTVFKIVIKSMLILY